MFGVNFFFVLSGFLITYLLLQEQKNNGKINLKLFYIRRSLRIWPLFYLAVFSGFFVLPMVSSMLNRPVDTPDNFLYYLLFLNNFIPPKGFAGLGVLWSIAIEEQFYLFWPILFIVFKNNQKWISPSIIVISLAYTLFVRFNYYDTLNCILDMGVGGTIAYFSFNGQLSKKFKPLKKSALIITYSIGAALILTREFWILNEFMAKTERLVYSIFFAFIILEQNYSQHSFYKMGNFKIISSLGKYTYGLYVLHFYAIYLIANLLDIFGVHDNIFVVLLIEPVLAFILSIFVAYLSYHLYEKHFLKLKKKFAS